MLGTIQMARRLLENIPTGVLCAIPEYFDFLSQVQQLTLCCLHGTISDVDEGWIGEACDECLQTWMTLGKIDKRGSAQLI